MTTNFDLAFENAKKNAPKGAKLLLHVCCAPCATYCLTRLLDLFDVTLFFFNDNITDKQEWQKRLDEVQKLVDVVNNGQFESLPSFPLKLVVKPFDNNAFFEVAKGLEQEREGGLRCTECFLLRLADTMQMANANNFDYFGTTLTVSPYKNSQLLNKLGESLQNGLQGALQEFSTKGNVFEKTHPQNDLPLKTKWLPSDFKKHNGYNESVRLSQKYDIYRQHYCGCCFALASMQQNTK